VKRWVPALLAFDRLCERALAVERAVRDEILLSWLTGERRDRLTARLNDHQTDFCAGGERFESGLFDWEARVFGAPPFPTGGHVLVGGAGGGREVKALVERGFAVTAFEPSEMWRSARAVNPTARVFKGAYRDLVAAVDGGGGPLAPLVGERFDAVVLGWSSLSYVTVAQERRALLVAVKRLAPAAPVLVSYVAQRKQPPAGRAASLRRRLRRLFAALGAPGTVEGNETFELHAGFMASLPPGEIGELAAAAGYAIARAEAASSAFAVLVPMETAK
jgi:hypothetical protein